jgi:hypothetical protein
MALACGGTVENAALKAGLSERTVYRWLADPAFRQQVAQTRAEFVQRTAAMLSGASMGAVKTLVDLQQDASVAPAVRRGAARDVLGMSLRFRENAELEPRLAALEAQHPGPQH